MSLWLLCVGGNYGFARVSLGAFWGYFVGCIEIIQNVLLLACVTSRLGQICLYLADSTSRGLELLFWLVFLVPVLVLHSTVGSDKVIPYSALLASVITAVFIALFLLSAMIYGDISRFTTATEAPYETHALKDFTFTPYASWFYLLSNLIPVLAGYSTKPKEIVASLLLVCFGTFFVLALCLFFAVPSFGRGGLEDGGWNGDDHTHQFFTSPTPMYLGYSKLFRLSHVGSLSFSLFPPLITVYVLFLVLVRQVRQFPV